MKAPTPYRSIGALLLALAAGWSHAAPMLDGHALDTASEFDGFSLPGDIEPFIVSRREPLFATFVSAGDAYFNNALYLFDGVGYYRLFGNDPGTEPGTSILLDYALGTALYPFFAPSSPEWSLMGLYHLGQTDPEGPGGTQRVLIERDEHTGGIRADFEDYPFDITDVWGCSGRELVPGFALPDAFSCDYIAREIAAGAGNYGYGDLVFTLDYDEPYTTTTPDEIPAPGVPLLVLAGLVGLLTSRHLARREPAQTTAGAAPLAGASVD